MQKERKRKKGVEKAKKINFYLIYIERGTKIFMRKKREKKKEIVYTLEKFLYRNEMNNLSFNVEGKERARGKQKKKKNKIVQGGGGNKK
jgi:hypothetical protein